MLPLAGILAANLAPLAGVLLLDWSLLEVVTYLWLEAALIVLVSALWIVVNRGWLALLLVPPYLLGMAALLALQLLLLTLAFFVLRFQDGFFDVLAEGRRVARGVLCPPATSVPGGGSKGRPTSATAPSPSASPRTSWATAGTARGRMATCSSGAAAG